MTRIVGRGALAVVALAVLALIYVIYQTVWGTPLRFKDLLLRQAVTEFLASPQMATQTGLVDGKWYDFSSGKLDPYSLADRQKRYDRVARFDAEIAAFDRAKLSLQDRMSYDIIRWGYARTLDDQKYPWLGANNKPYPVEQAFGIQKGVINFLLSTHQIKNAKLVHAYVDRLDAIGPLIDAVNADIKRQAAMGVIAPDFVIDRSVEQMQAFLAPEPDKNPLVTHLAEKVKALGLENECREDLEQAAEAVITVVYPAYKRLIATEMELRKRATHDAGIWHIKGGSAYYADQLKKLTTTDMTPDEIHAYGLAEVERINAEADAILKSVGLTKGSVGERLNALMADQRFIYPSTEAGRNAQLQRYRLILGHMRAMLPDAFAHIPKLPLEVRRVPLFAEKGSPSAYYERPSLDGSRPGVFFANERNPAEAPMWAMATTAYHEGIPGHHMQIATGMEIEGLPYQRRMAYSPAFGEGWALYAERLAMEMGAYKGDPYGDLGRLQAELFRAVRLVVDTGMHAKHWSREQAIDYMRQIAGVADSEATAEIERYVVWPGQACAYKIGMKAILDLRAEAKRKLGPKFDLRRFHTLVLENGAMPLLLLQRNAEAWIVSEQALR